MTAKIATSIGRATTRITALVLHSGGLDSTVCLRLAQEQGRAVRSLGIDYGQTHAIELEYADQQAARFGVERTTLHVTWSHPKRVVPRGRTLDAIRQVPSPAFLPGRNLVFLALASAHACGVNADEVWIGINELDCSGYPDCTSAFLQTYIQCLANAIPSGPKIIAPLIGMTKPQIASEAKRLGLAPTDTWSCYRPKLVNGLPTPCGLCDACVLNAHAWTNL